MLTELLPGAVLRRLLQGCLPALLCLAIPPSTAQDLDNGEQLFRTLCARCHGILGEGGEGPSLKRARLDHAPDDETLLSVISAGIPGTGMPGARQLSGGDARDVAAYVRSLGQLPEEPVPGDALAGQQIYETIGNCASCHIANGVGTGIGPELTDVGLRRNAAYLRQSVLSPDADQPRVVDRFRGTLNAFLTVRIVTERGAYEGMRINEDAFSVQMRDITGRIYSFEKADLISYEKAFGHSFMPGYSAALNEQQTDDLVSYLMSLKGENR
ncbi:MAG: c-type cytochrome [Gammaproteobacteria bacterium]|nr:c-type cytochrome [Pseudomonadales bacterium]MCP5348956.1 c-type cytochrome [Pseudomonadales bacterium]